MRFQKILALMLLAAVGGSNLSRSQTADNNAQSQARELLRKKMMEAGNDQSMPTPAQAPTAPVPAAPAAPAPVITEAQLPAKVPNAPVVKKNTSMDDMLREQVREAIAAMNVSNAPSSAPKAAKVTAKPVKFAAPAAPASPVVVAMPVLGTPTYVTPPVKAEAKLPARAPNAPTIGKNTSMDDMLREQVRQAIAALNAGEAAAKPATVSTPSAPAPAPAHSPMTMMEAPAAVAQPVKPATVEPETAISLRDQMRHRKMQLDAEAAAQKQTETKQPVEKAKIAEVKKTEPAVKPKSTTPVVASQAPSVSGPAPGSKEAQLDELLQQYKADKITPVEYHQKRAALVGNP
jgi:hypothetical protein